MKLHTKAKPVSAPASCRFKEHNKPINLQVTSYCFALGILACGLTPSVLLADSAAESDKLPVTFKGNVMLDATGFDGVYGKGEELTDLQVRRATLAMEAELSSSVDVKLSAKLEDGLDEVELKDAYVNWKMSKGKQLTVGLQNEPVGMESNQSSKQIPATERSIATSLFTPGSNTGVKYSSKDSNKSFDIGVFEADEDSDKSRLAVSGRATLAVHKNKKQTIHLGVSGTSRDMGGNSIKLKDEGEVDPAENIVSSSRYDVNRVNTGGVEVALLSGPLTVQAEWFETEMDLAENSADPRYSGGYLQGAWMFGDGKVKRRYSNGELKVAGLKDNSAWEAVLRVGQADLRDADGGTRAETVMAGLNYYKGKNFRAMTSVTAADTSESGPNSSGNAVNVRMQYDF